MSDNRGEYTSNEFGIFCRDVGIKRDLTTPYNSQQNDVPERKNRKIIEPTKTMIHDQDLPMHLWDEETWTIVYVQNILSHSAHGFNTPGDMLKRNNPKQFSSYMALMCDLAEKEPTWFVESI